MPIGYEIHPALGIARVGTSSAHYVFDGIGSVNAPRRDGPNGALLRQAVEFRVYKCERDASGKMIHAEEMTPDKASVQWDVHVANRKATAVRRFLDENKGRRNEASGDDQKDSALIIDAGRQTIALGNPAKKLTGAFKGHPVELGDVVVTAMGRLLFRGGDGSAGSPGNAPTPNFADNDDWFDTICDGPIRARVTPNGAQPVEAVAAFVVVGPPDFAPAITNLVTMHDALVDVAVSRGVLVAPDPIVFSLHVRPILERAMAYQWVTRAAHDGYADDPSGGHAHGGPGDFKLAQLGDPTAPNAGRVRIFKFLRDPEKPASANLKRMPRINDDENSGDVFPLTRVQYRSMLLWSQGKFVTNGSPPAELDPETITRLHLEAACGGPFFPGIEIGRVLRDKNLYAAGEAFRFSPDHVKPGQLTQGNALPWQADFQACQWEESETEKDGTVTTVRLAWWPAQRPDDVLKTKDGVPVVWARGTPDTAEGMITNWHRFGFVKEDPANPGAFIEFDRDSTLPDAEIA